MSACLEFQSVSKKFPGVLALDDVSFAVEEGTVHGLVGENGAGKSTLLKILSGAYSPTSGKLLVRGQAEIFRSTREAMDAGIAVIHQELNLVPEMTVEENLLLGNMPKRGCFIDRKAMREKALSALSSLAGEIDPRVKVRRLSIGQRQLLEITKALIREAKILAFDEPTSSLSEWEVERLFKVISGLRTERRAVIYVSHRLAEVFTICDRVTVFRDGRHIQTFMDMKALGEDMLVGRMIGREIDDIYHYSPRPLGPEALHIEGALGKGLSAPCSFSVRAGEILGFFGLVGAGRSELMKLIYGANPLEAGSVSVSGKSVRIASISDALKCGIVLCPEDRKNEGIIPMRSVGENINIFSRRGFAKLGLFLDVRREGENASYFVRKLGIKTPSVKQLVMNLSGGNQQKVILARWLNQKINVILLDEPTRGIDVGAKSEIYNIIYDLARQGIAVVVISSELPEILGISDRIVVMREGRIVESIDRAAASEESLLKRALPDSAA